jgi:hypothetical protein
VDGDGHLAVDQGEVELLRKQALAAGLAQGAVEDRVAGGLDNDDLDPVAGRIMRAGETVLQFVRLGQRQRAAARSDFEFEVLAGPAGRSGNRRFPF